MGGICKHDFRRRTVKVLTWRKRGVVVQKRKRKLDFTIISNSVVIAPNRRKRSSTDFPLRFGNDDGVQKTFRFLDVVQNRLSVGSTIYGRDGAIRVLFQARFYSFPLVRVRTACSACHTGCCVHYYYRYYYYYRQYKIKYFTPRQNKGLFKNVNKSEFPLTAIKKIIDIFLSVIFSEIQIDAIITENI